jgi:hypothetical protein
MANGASRSEGRWHFRYPLPPPIFRHAGETSVALARLVSGNQVLDVIAKARSA